MRLVRFPSWIVDRGGRVVWENDAANRLFGDQRGKLYSSFVAPEYLALAQEQFARKLLGQQVTDYEVDLLTADGSRVRVETSSVPLPSAEGEIPLGVFRPRPSGGRATRIAVERVAIDASASGGAAASGSGPPLDEPDRGRAEPERRNSAQSHSSGPAEARCALAARSCRSCPQSRPRVLSVAG
jgi:PAS domain S-box-containing protein